MSCAMELHVYSQPPSVTSESSNPQLVLIVSLFSVVLHDLLAAGGVGTQHLSTDETQHGRLSFVAVLPPRRPLGTLEC